MTKRQFTTPLLFFMFLLAGCVTAAPQAREAAPDQVRVVTATPASAQIGVGPTYADPAAAAVQAANEAYYLGMTATADAQARIATQAFVAQLTVQANADRVQATAQAVSAAATATAAQLSLQRQIADVTATAGALRLADTVATQAAAEAEQARLETDARAYQAELDRRGAAFGALLRDLILIGFAVFAGVLAYILLRWAAAVTAIHARMKLINLRAGLLLDPHSGAFQALPGGPPASLPEEISTDDEDTAPWLEKLRSWRGPVVAKDVEIDNEREARAAWTEACKRWLRWTEVEAGDGAPVGLSRRRFMAATGCTRADYENARDLLLAHGLLVRRGTEYKLRGALTVEKALDAPVWATSYDVPVGVKTPEISPPPGPGRAAGPGWAGPGWAGPQTVNETETEGAERVVIAARLAVPFDVDQ